jgi:nucleotide-binding universal stress UspA family protein
MAFGTITLYLDGGPAATTGTEIAAHLARSQASHLVGLAVTGNELFETSLGAGLLPRAELNAALAGARRRAQALASAFTEQVARHELRSHEAVVDDRDAPAALARHSLFADLVVLPRPAADAAGRNWSRRDFEQALLELSSPAIVLPPTAQAGVVIGRRVVIAWKPERPCARALASALPLLKAADQVTLLHVDSPFDDVLRVPARDDVERAGARLRRDGVTAAARFVQSSSEAGDVLLEEIRRDGADLVVMGAWGRPRWSERAFGGCTRTLLSELDVATFTTH